MARVESYRAQFLERVNSAWVDALKETASVADRLPGSPSDLRAEVTGRMRGRFGSDQPYAKAQERGAYITPRRGRSGRGGRRPMLKFADGKFRPRARIRPKRYLAQAAAQWPGILLSHLRRV